MRCRIGRSPGSPDPGLLGIGTFVAGVVVAENYLKWQHPFFFFFFFLSLANLPFRPDPVNQYMCTNLGTSRGLGRVRRPTYLKGSTSALVLSCCHPLLRVCSPLSSLPPFEHFVLQSLTIIIPSIGTNVCLPFHDFNPDFFEISR